MFIQRLLLLVVLRCDGEKCILGHWGNEPPGPALSPGVLQLQANACYLHFCQVRTVSKVVDPRFLQPHPRETAR